MQKYFAARTYFNFPKPSYNLLGDFKNRTEFQGLSFILPALQLSAETPHRERSPRRSYIERIHSDDCGTRFVHGFHDDARVLF